MINKLPLVIRIMAHIIVNFIRSASFWGRELLIKQVKHILYSHIFWSVRLLNQHYCWNVVTSLAVKKEEHQKAFSADCCALDWVAVAHIFKLQIENFSIHLKIIRIREAEWSEKSGRHLDKSAIYKFIVVNARCIWGTAFLLSRYLKSKISEDHLLCLHINGKLRIECPVGLGYGKVFHALP